MSVITEPVILDKTGRLIVENLKSIAEVLWSEKVPVVESKDVNLYDYDGTRVYSYERVEFLGLSELPGNPAHNGLVAQGWNWDLADAKAYVQKYGKLDIGQTYTTDDGKTKLYINIGYPENLTANLRFWQSEADAVVVDWGDGSTETFETAGNAVLTHTYAAEGNYVISLEVADGCTMRIGQGTTQSTTLAGAGGLNGFFSQGPSARLAGRDALFGVSIGSGVTTIGSGAFAYNTNLKLISIPDTCTTICDLAFFACIDLHAVIVPDGVTRAGNYVFNHLEEAKAICLPATATTLGTNTFGSCIALERIVLPEGVTTIGGREFHNCRNAEEIIIPDTVEGAIGDYAFYGCCSLTELSIPVGVTSIGNYAFSQCYNLRDITLPEGLLTIGKGAFTSCFGFLNFVIPSTVTSIAGFAFLYNDGANSFRVLAEEPPVLEATAFTSIFNGITIYVPYSEDHSILEAYKAATGWSSRADGIVEWEG